MTLWKRLAYLLPWRRRAAERDMQEELQSIAAMAEPRELGNLTRAAEDARAEWGWTWLEQAGQDVRYVMRTLRKSPAFAATAVLSLGLGIGANTALFSILNSLLIKPLPVHEPSRLVLIDHGSWTNPIWEEVRARQADMFDSAFAWSGERFDLSLHGETDVAPGLFASGRMFDVLGIHPIAGRTFTEADDVRGGGADRAVAVISYGFWQRRFGGSMDALGKRLTISRASFTIIGVTPRDFFGPAVGSSADIMVPLGCEPIIRGKDSALDARSDWWLEIMGRLKPGQTVSQATDALRAAQPSIRLATIPPQWKADDKAKYLSDPFHLISAATGTSSLRGRYGQPLETIMVVVMVVLLIACANLANLLLARATATRHEFSVRLALGASRFRLARQLLAESVILAAAGAVAGLVFAQWGSALIVRQFSTASTTVFLDLSMDWRVLAFTTCVALATAVLFGLVPALGVVHVAPNEALKESSRSITSDRRFGLRNALVVVQVALSLSLVVGAMLFVRTFTSLTGASLGFNPDPLMVVEVSAVSSRVPVAQRADLYQRLREAASAVPGVASASISAITPVSQRGWNTTVEPPPGAPRLPPRQRLSWVNATSPGWFKTYGIHVLQGRDISEADRRGTPPVVVVNEAFMKRFMPAPNPLGQAVLADINGPDVSSLTVIGVVSDSVYQSARAGLAPTIYVPLTQVSQVPSRVNLTVESASGRPAALRPVIAAALTQADADASYTLGTVDEQLRASVRQERLVAMLSGFFGGLALLLAGLGLYGVTSYSVSRRRAEIAIRTALGASSPGVVRLVLMRVGVLVVSGVAIGIVLGLWVGKLVGSLLFQLGPRDPLTFAGAAVILITTGLVAGWLPARRASRVDPTSVLKG
jgi:putative ABC transport system permease protein